MGAKKAGSGGCNLGAQTWQVEEVKVDKVAVALAVVVY